MSPRFSLGNAVVVESNSDTAISLPVLDEGESELRLIGLSPVVMGSFPTHGWVKRQGRGGVGHCSPR